MLSSAVAASDESVRYNSQRLGNDSVPPPLTINKHHDALLGSSGKLASKYNSLLNHQHQHLGANPAGPLHNNKQAAPGVHRDQHLTQPGRARSSSSGAGSPLENNHKSDPQQRLTIGGPGGDSGGDGGGASGVDCRRMNTNGFDRNGMTGNANTTTESLSAPWHHHPDVAVAACQSTPSRGSTATALTSVAPSSHEPPPPLPPTGAPPYYRSASAFSRRSVFSTTASSLPLFTPPVYVPPSSHPQFSLTSPYYYPGYPISIGSPLMGPYPTSYPDSTSGSAAEMLRQLQQHGNAIPQRHMPTYLQPYMSTTSPGPHIPRPMTAGMDPAHRHESKSPKSDALVRGSPSKESPGGGGGGSALGRSRSPHHPQSGLHPHHHHAAHHQHHKLQFESGISRDAGSKPLSPHVGRKEDTHIFTRPVDIGTSHHPRVGSSADFKFPGVVKQEEPPHKRHKSSSEARHHYPASSQRTSTSIPSSAAGGGGGGGEGLGALPVLPPAGHATSYLAHLHYPPFFVKGSIIQLASGDMKRVEDMRTEDFVLSADSSNLKIDSSTVVKIEESRERPSAFVGFSVGDHRIQVGDSLVVWNETSDGFE